MTPLGKSRDGNVVGSPARGQEILPVPQQQGDIYPQRSAASSTIFAAASQSLIPSPLIDYLYLRASASSFLLPFSYVHYVHSEPASNCLIYSFLPSSNSQKNQSEGTCSSLDKAL